MVSLVESEPNSSTICFLVTQEQSQIPIRSMASVLPEHWVDIYV